MGRSRPTDARAMSSVVFRKNQCGDMSGKDRPGPRSRHAWRGSAGSLVCTSVMLAVEWLSTGDRAWHQGLPGRSEARARSGRGCAVSRPCPRLAGSHWARLRADEPEVTGPGACVRLNPSGSREQVMCRWLSDWSGSGLSQVVVGLRWRRVCRRDNQRKKTR